MTKTVSYSGEDILSPINSKSLWREARTPAVDRLPISPGRQQRAGTRDYLCAFNPTASDCISYGVTNHQILYNIALLTGSMVCVYAQREQNIAPGFDRYLRLAGSHHYYTTEIDTTAVRVQAGNFLQHAAQLENHGQSASALDLIYGNVGKLIKNEAFDKLDLILRQVDVDSTSLNLLVGLLCATLRAKSKLSHRTSFYNKVDESFRKRGLWEENLLVGLDG